ncbi:hypothetical protein LCGC14_2615690 [marine sediment metagenome]|uniref:Uncharacterized protein n=1 Tax=marine sediment metagenome TaxID=412755 RepID=A0A0F9CX84_9ZZZZ
MNDFWEWMEKNKYGKYGYVKGTSIKPPNQMLIGYMMEYLREENGMLFLNTSGTASINTVYEQYVKDVEKVERDHLLERMTGDKKG